MIALTLDGRAVAPATPALVRRPAEPPPPFTWLMLSAALAPLAWLLARPADEPADGVDW